MGWGRLRHGRRNISCPHAAPGPVPSSPLPRPGPDLVLAAPAGVVQVVVAPVVVGPVLGLLIQPVELVGAALHVILQRVQVLLPLLGAGLRRDTRTAQPRAPPCASPRATPMREPSRRGSQGHPNEGTLQEGSQGHPNEAPPRSQGLLPAASGIWLGSRSCFPGRGARQGLGGVAGDTWVL